jgi:hypothetical protein
MALKNQDDYKRALHAMQTGVAYDMQNGSQDTQPKHLRVGVNSAHVSSAAIATLLIEKGIFTIGEYEDALAIAMEKEAREYEERLSRDTGTTIKLL